MSWTLITGASSGIGEAFARRLAADGHNLVLAARSGDKLKRLADELSAKHGINTYPIAIDLTEQGSDARLFDETTEKGIEIDWLINNAGFGAMGDFAELDLEWQLQMITLNVSVLVALTHRFLPGMRERNRGTIINVSSAAGFQPVPFFSVYSATKSFVTSFTEAVAEENRPFGIRMLALCPGSTETNFHDVAKMDRTLSFKGQETPEQVVNTALRALSTGRTKIVSGWANWLIASAVNLIPNSLITRVTAKGLRKRFHDK